MKKALFALSASLLAVSLFGEETSKTKPPLEEKISGHELVVGAAKRKKEASRYLTTTPFIYDKHLSPYVGASNLITTHRFLEKSEDYLLRRATAKSSESILAGFARILDLSLVWAPINAVSYLTQRQVFGLGYRQRELRGISSSHFHFKLKVPPYASHGNVGVKMKGSMPTSDVVTYYTAGTESTSIMTDQMKMEWLQSGKIDGRQGSLYSLSALDLIGTASMARGELSNSPTNQLYTNEVSGYIYYMNQLYPRSIINQKTIAKQSLVALIDPFLWYSAYAELFYVVKGEPVDMPMIPFFGGAKFLPSAKLGLTPYGPEYYAQTFWRTNDGNPIYLYYKWGSLSGAHHRGAGIQAPYIFNSDETSIGFTFDWFHQFKAGANDISLSDSSNPNYWTNQRVANTRYYFDYNTFTWQQQITYTSQIIDEKKFYDGFAATLIGTQKISGVPGTSLYAQLGYKTKGYVPGESYKNGLIARGGLAFTF
ncbi:MAG: hypothetical protein P0S95_06415 [Rhabdochlamydiaceae bacterium]|nr:hypothetical protein [Candidatus Amphrikana amoebophyrae]